MGRPVSGVTVQGILLELPAAVVLIGHWLIEPPAPAVFITIETSRMTNRYGHGSTPLSMRDVVLEFIGIKDDTAVVAREKVHGVFKDFNCSFASSKAIRAM